MSFKSTISGFSSNSDSLSLNLKVVSLVLFACSWIYVSLCFMVFTSEFVYLLVCSFYSCCLRHCYAHYSFSRGELSKSSYHHTNAPLSVWRATNSEADCLCPYPMCIQHSWETLLESVPGRHSTPFPMLLCAPLLNCRSSNHDLSPPLNLHSRVLNAS